MVLVVRNVTMCRHAAWYIALQATLQRPENTCCSDWFQYYTVHSYWSQTYWYLVRGRWRRPAPAASSSHVSLLPHSLSPISHHQHHYQLHTPAAAAAARIMRFYCYQVSANCTLADLQFGPISNNRVNANANPIAACNVLCVTLSSPVMPNGYTSKRSGPY